MRVNQPVRRLLEHRTNVRFEQLSSRFILRRCFEYVVHIGLDYHLVFRCQPELNIGQGVCELSGLQQYAVFVKLHILRVLYFLHVSVNNWSWCDHLYFSFLDVQDQLGNVILLVLGPLTQAASELDVKFEQLEGLLYAFLGLLVLVEVHIAIALLYQQHS